MLTGANVRLMMRHVKSKQYVSLVPKAVAELEPACTLVTLSATPSSASLLDVWPRFKLRTSGQPVSVGDSCVFVNSSSGLALHVSDAAHGDECGEELKFGSLHEVNASSTARAGFKVAVFADHGTKGDSIHGGGYVRMWHAEAEGALALNPVFNAENTSTGGADASGPVHVRCIVGDVPANELESSNALWAVELTADAHRRGGPVTWEPDDDPATAVSESFRLRHVGTGLYLSTGGDVAVATSAAPAASAARTPAVSSSDTPATSLNAYMQSRRRAGQKPVNKMKVVSSESAFDGSETSLFRFCSTQAQTDSIVPPNATVRLRAAKGDVSVRTISTRQVAATVSDNVSDLHVAGAMVVRVQVCTQPASESRRDEDAFVLRVVGIEESADVTKVLSARASLVRVMLEVRAARSREPRERDLRAATDVLASLILFTLGVDGAADALRVDGAPVAERQRIIREQRVLNVCAKFLEDRRGDDEGQASERLAQHCYRLLLHSFRDNPRNEVFCAQWIPVMYRDACTPKGTPSSTSAGQTLYALLDTCKEISRAPEYHFEDKIDELCSKVVATKEYRFIKLLCGLCSVGSDAIEAHQNIIVSRLFRNLSAERRASATSESRNGLVVTFHVVDTPASGGDVGVEVAMSGLGDGAPIPLEAFYARAAADSIEYVEALPLLFQFVCLGKNYKSIDSVSALVPYDAACRVVMRLRQHTAFRARLLRYIEHCFVRCEPFMEKTMPVYTRILTDGAVASFVREDFCGPAHTQFKTLRDWLLAYLTALAPFSRGDTDSHELTLAVLCVANALLRCGAFDDADSEKLTVSVMRLLSQGFPTAATADAGASAKGKKVIARKPSHNAAGDDAPLDVPHLGLSSGERHAVGAMGVMCQILSRLADVQTNDRITGFVSRFLGGERKAVEAGAAKAFANRVVPELIEDASAREGAEDGADDWILDDKFWSSSAEASRPWGEALMTPTLQMGAPQLAAAAFSTLVQHYSQREDVMNALCDVQLLERPADVAAFALAVDAMADLRRASDTTEVWLSPLFGASSSTRNVGGLATHDLYGLAESALRRNAAICCGRSVADFGGAAVSTPVLRCTGRVALPALEGGGGGAVPVGASAHAFGPELQIPSSVYPEGQQILRNLRAHTIALDIARAVVESAGTSHGPSGPSGLSDVAKATLRAAHMFLVAFMRKNAVNQSLLIDSVGVLVSHVPLCVGAERTLVALLEGNVKAISVADELVANACAAMIVKGPRDVRWLLPLLHLVECNGYAVKRSQLLVLRVLLASGQKKFCVRLTTDEEVSQRTAALRGMDGGLTGDLAYQCVLLQLLAKTCAGRAHDAVAKCQALLPARSCIGHMATLMTEHAVLFSAYVRFFTAAYLEPDTPLLAEDVIRIGGVYVDVLLSRVVRSHGEFSADWAEALYLSVLPSLCIFMKDLALPDAPGATAVIVEALELLVPKAVNQINRECALAAAHVLRDQLRDDGLHERLDRLLAGDIASAPVVRTPVARTKSDEFHELVARLVVSSAVKASIKNEFALGAKLFTGPASSSFLNQRLGTVRLLLEADSASIVSAALRVLRSVIILQDVGEAVVGALLSGASHSGYREEPEHVEAARVRVADMQGAIANIGIIPVVSKVMAQAREDAVFRHGLEFVSAMLVGGNRFVQEAFYKCFTSDASSHLLMARMHARMMDVTGAIHLRKKRRLRNAGGSGDMQSEESAFAEELESVRVVGDIMRFLQQLCEGQNATLQAYLSCQTGATESFDIVAAAATIAKDLEACADLTLLPLMKGTLEFLIEAMQGPCYANQRVVADGKGIDAAVRLLAWTAQELAQRNLHGPCKLYEEVRESALELLRAVLEGRGNEAVQERMAEALNFSRVRAIVLQAYAKRVQQEAVGRPVGSAVLDETALPKNAFDCAPLKEGFLAFLLMQQLADSGIHEGMDAQVSLAAFEKEGEVLGHIGPAMAMEAYWFFANNTRRVEVSREGLLERVYFPRPLLAFYLTDVTKSLFMWQVDRSSSQAKISGLLAVQDDWIGEMRHQQDYSQYRLFRWLSRRLEALKALSFALAVVINGLLLLSYSVRSATTPDMNFEDMQAAIVNGGTSPIGGPASATAIMILGIFQTCTSVAVVGIYFANFGPLIIRRRWAQRVKSVSAWKKTRSALTTPASPVLIRWLGAEQLWETGPEGMGGSVAVRCVYAATSLWYLLSDWTITFYVCYVTFTVLGNIISPFFFAFHLTDFIYRFESLKNVVRAVTYNRVQLLMTVLLGLILMYIFSVIGFNVFRAVYVINNENRCEPTLYAGTVIFYMFFWSILVVIFLNVIFGVIVDTFGNLRDKNKEQAEDMDNVCFVCGLGLGDFERANVDFTEHVHEDHNMWAYSDLCCYLKTRDPTEMTGTEAFLAKFIAEDNVSFFPQHRALSLPEGGGSDAATAAPADGVPSAADIAAIVKEAVRAELAKQGKARA